MTNVRGERPVLGKPFAEGSCPPLFFGPCRLREGRSGQLMQGSEARSLALPSPAMHPLMDITAKEAPVLSDF